MAATFSLRAGSTFRANVEYREPPALGGDPLTAPFINTESASARLQIRSAAGNRRVILSAAESTAASAVLTPDSNGHWHIFLGASLTRTLPPVSYIEVELVSDTNADDVTTLFTGTLHVSPEQVHS